MFTGIIAAVGSITRIAPTTGGQRLAIDAGGLDMSDVAIGDSIAVNGVCLTAVVKDGKGFEADVSNETLRVTTGLAMPGEVNLEKSLRLADRLGGHLVSGHVDGVGEVLRFDALGDNRLLAIRAPTDIARYIARKGSVTVQGVSLTVNAVDGDDFEINLIPHTIAMTTLRTLERGSPVNLEVDMMARYVERITSRLS
jgi:riboflavin synthase